MAKLCGLAVYFSRGAVSGSYALLRENVPIYTFDSPQHVTAHQSAFKGGAASPKLVKHLPFHHKQGRCEEAGAAQAPYQSMGPE